LPFNISYENLVAGEFAEIQLINQNRMWQSNNQGSIVDDFYFVGSTIIDKSVKIHVTSFAGDILEGTFEGTLKTRSGSTIIVQNGRFRIKINVIIYGN